MEFAQALRIVLHWEGGFSNHPKDPGGATNLGITQRTLSEWRKRSVTLDEVRVLQIADVEPIYRTRYWDECRCTEMPDGVDLVIFDCAVNQGPGQAKRLLQRSLGVAEDGILGPITMRAVRSQEAENVINELTALRAVHYASLRSNFHLGWFRRLIDIHKHALT